MSFPFKLPLLLDGATGTHMIAAGMDRGACPEAWILDHPDVLRSLQHAYVDAGSDALLAPTFGANRARLAAHGLDQRVDEINERLVALTREASGGKALVFGDVSPTGLFVEPFGDASFAQIVEIYHEQMAALQRAGVDGILCETMLNLSDARAAVLAAKGMGLPVLCSLTADEMGRTLGGPLLPALITLEAMGAAAVGLNCSTGPGGMAPLLAEARRFISVPLLAKPNAGLPGDGDYLAPGAFTQGFEALVAAGVRVAGGCCGSGPQHIAALRGLLGAAPPLSTPEIHEPVAVHESRIFPLPASPRIGGPLDCGDTLADNLMDLTVEDADIALVRVKTPGDAVYLAEAAPTCPLPIMLLSHSAAALDAALALYQGRAFVSAEGVADAAEVRCIAARYGAMVC